MNAKECLIGTEWELCHKTDLRVLTKEEELGGGKGYHIHSIFSKTERPTSLMSPMQDQTDEGNTDGYCCQPSLIHAVQQRDVGWGYC